MAYLPPETFEADTFPGYVVHDPARDRDIPIVVRYPRDATGPLPVVVFSPGGAYVPRATGYSEWGTLLARAGYFTVNLSHPEAAGGAHCAPLAIPASECDAAHFVIGEPAEGGTLNGPWYHRPMDARAVLDDLAAIAEAAGVSVDLDRIAIVGHSGGAFTTMALAGARIDYSPSVRAVDMSDPRPRAFLANSPQGVGHVGLTETSWDLIARPVMTQTGRNDRTEGEPPSGRLDAAMHMPAPDKYLTYLDSEDATHSVFGLGPDASRMLELYVGSAGVAFLDAYVRDRSDARTWLGSGSIDEWSDGVATIMSR
ncbi:MAG: hypothetical protein IT379_01245 [Deltaproteobacteria bacterium]|nr:hypothetical protein [Deltaproteobacteria bacterium]